MSWVLRQSIALVVFWVRDWASVPLPQLTTSSRGVQCLGGEGMLPYGCIASLLFPLSSTALFDSFCFCFCFFCLFCFVYVWFCLCLFCIAGLSLLFFCFVFFVFSLICIVCLYILTILFDRKKKLHHLFPTLRYVRKSLIIPNTSKGLSGLTPSMNHGVLSMQSLREVQKLLKCETGPCLC